MMRTRRDDGRQGFLRDKCVTPGDRPTPGPMARALLSASPTAVRGTPVAEDEPVPMNANRPRRKRFAAVLLAFAALAGACRSGGDSPEPVRPVRLPPTTITEHAPPPTIDEPPRPVEPLPPPEFEQP